MVSLFSLSTGPQGYLFLVLTIWAGSLGVPVPEEIPLLTAGILAALGVLDIYWAIVIGGLACFTGDLLVYSVGRKIGYHLSEHKHLRRFMRGRMLLRARHLYVRRGPWTLSIARLLPGLKTPFLFTAGALRMSWGRFLFHDLISVIILAPALVLLAYHSSLTLAQLDHLVRETGVIAVPAFLLLLAALVGWWAWARHRRQVRRARRLAAAHLAALRRQLPGEEPAPHRQSA